MKKQVTAMGRKCIGLIEARGLAAAIQAADTAAKSANVKLLGYEYSGHSGMIVVKQTEEPEEKESVRWSLP